MSRLSLLLSFLLLFIIGTFAEVKDLTPENFDQVVDGSQAVFVEFFCSLVCHCKSLAPEYELVGEAFTKQPVVIAKVDADQHKELGSRFGIQGFPTLKFFPKGSKEAKPYEGGRTADDIINFINKEVGTNARLKKAPSAVVTLDPTNFDSIALDKNKHVLVEFYAPWCGHCKHLAPDYEKLANIYVNEPDVVIAKVDADAHRDLGSRYGVTGFPTLKWFAKDSKENPEAYEKGRDIPSFVEFINQKAGTQRDASGRLSAQAGRVSALDKIAAQFLSGNQQSLLKEAEEALKTLKDLEAKNAEYYLKLMQAIVSKGKDFVKKETDRLVRLLEGDVSPKKLDEFTIRKNILSAFSS